MITKTLSFLLHSGRAAARFTVLLGLTGLALCGSARAAVVANDPFSIELIGYNAAAPGGNFYAINQFLTPTFGTTQTFANAAANGQTLTVFSSETQNGNVFTDTIRISVPNTFIPAGTVDNNGAVVDSLLFSIGNYYIPTGGTANTLDYTIAITNVTTTGFAAYTLNNNPGTINIPSGNQHPLFSNGNKGYSDYEAITTPNNGPISAYNPSAFTITITYSPVPEPSPTGAVLLGAAGLFGVAVVRRRRALA